MKKASLFSGIGGIDLAAQWTGMDTVVFCEKEEFPQRVLRKHWPDVPIINDVRNFTKRELEKRGIGAIDIISAGYPCQPFSVAGKRKGAEDDRHLWPEVKRILSEIRPRWFVGENVAGHVALGLDDVLADLESIGYTAQAFVIPACAVYASHRRDRVFIVAYTATIGLQAQGAEQQATRVAGSSKDVADTCSSGCEEWRTVEFGLGGMLDELSDWLDGRVMNPLDTLTDFIINYPQPALMGQPQYDWEPPRVATGVKNREERLKALGNAVDPLQIFPIMYAIKLINDWLREGKGMKCPYCKEETDTLYNNPFSVIDIRTGEEKKDVMCRECLTFTLQEMSPYGNDCPGGKCEINAREKVGTEEWRHKYFGAEWTKVEGDGNE